MKNKLINEYEAALRFDLSPTLLRWMTLNGVVDKTKLNYTKKDEIYYYDQDELTSLNKKMEGMWPKTKQGQRPHIPEGIKREIKQEARFACPACNKSHGEIAHIDCVSATHCNHPKNLIFLCPDHHTEYDNSLIPSNIERDEILILKESLKIFQRQLWKIKGCFVGTYLSALNSAKSLLGIHEDIRNNIPEKEFQDTLQKIVNLTQQHATSKVSRSDLNDSKFIEAEIESYLENNQENICPLCEGHGETSFYDLCPVCLGSGEIDSETKNRVDLSIYRMVDCYLCDGSGSNDGDDCPGCRGEGQVSQGFYDNHDWSMYDLIDCELCGGSGKHDYDDCPPCSGEGKVSQGFSDNHDWSGYDMVNCDLCSGSGKHDYDDCLPCNGEGKVSRVFFENHDWSRYDMVNCDLCSGSGKHDYDDCPPCSGEGKVSRSFSENHNWSTYELVDCMLCSGTGTQYDYDCPPCNGSGRVTQGFYENHDWSRYDDVECELCRGEGRYHAEDCEPCKGEGRVSLEFSRRHNWKKYR